MSVLHTLSDGSVLRVMGARELIRIPVWQGNRIIDSGHVAAIAAAIGGELSRLDFGYRIVKYNEIDAGGHTVIQSYLIDGQHRAKVLRDGFDSGICVPDFPCVVLEKQVESELEAIAYFNALNNVKPMQWSDPNLVASKYISELEKAFNTKKLKVLRKGRCHRPYLSVDRIRDALIAAGPRLKEDSIAINSFIAKVVIKNKTLLENAELAVALGSSKKKEAEMNEKGYACGFMLGLDTKLGWIPELL